MNRINKKLESYKPQFPDLDRWLKVAAENDILPKGKADLHFFITMLATACEHDFRAINQRIQAKYKRLNQLFTNDISKIESEEIRETKADMEAMYALLSNLEYMRHYYLVLSVETIDTYKQQINYLHSENQRLKKNIMALGDTIDLLSKSDHAATETIFELHRQYGDNVLKIYTKHLNAEL